MHNGSYGFGTRNLTCWQVLRPLPRLSNEPPLDPKYHSTIRTIRSQLRAVGEPSELELLMRKGPDLKNRTCLQSRVVMQAQDPGCWVDGAAAPTKYAK